MFTKDHIENYIKIYMKSGNVIKFLSKDFVEFTYEKSGLRWRFTPSSSTNIITIKVDEIEAIIEVRE
jgi:hypothetical protein